MQINTGRWNGESKTMMLSAYDNSDNFISITCACALLKCKWLPIN